MWRKDVKRMPPAGRGEPAGGGKHGLQRLWLCVGPVVMTEVAVMAMHRPIKRNALFRRQRVVERLQRRPRGLHAGELARHHLLHAVFAIERSRLRAGGGDAGEAIIALLRRTALRHLLVLVPERLLVGSQLKPRFEIGKTAGGAG